MTNQEVKTSVINRIVVVVPEFRQWTGTRAMHEGDFQVGANGKLPPKEVAKSLGLKAIIDPAHLRVFDRLKHRADALLSSCGVRYLSGWAVPEEKTTEVLRELDIVVSLYEDAKAQFLGSYDALVDDWAQQNPAFAKEIIDGKLDRNDIASRFAAGYEAFRLQPVTDEKAVALAQSIGGLAGDLIDDVSQCARTFFRESFLGKDRANRKTVNALIRIRERLNGLSFLSGSILPLVQAIDAVTTQMPKEGYFGGDAYWKLSSLVQTLGDRSLLEGILRQQVQVTGLVVSEAQDERSADNATTDSVEVKSDGGSEGVTQQEQQPDLLAEIDAFFEGAVSDDKTVDVMENEHLPDFSALSVSAEEVATTVAAATCQTDAASAGSALEGVTVDLKGDDASASVTLTGTSRSEEALATLSCIPCVDVGEGMFF